MLSKQDTCQCTMLVTTNSVLGYDYVVNNYLKPAHILPTWMSAPTD